jgi:hypothetical protein
VKRRFVAVMVPPFSVSHSSLRQTSAVARVAAKKCYATGFDGGREPAPTALCPVTLATATTIAIEPSPPAKAWARRSRSGCRCFLPTLTDSTATVTALGVKAEIDHFGCAVLRGSERTLRFSQLFQFTFCLLAVLSLIGFSGEALASESYTSPQFGYVVTWNQDWQKEHESSVNDLVDQLHLTNNEDYVHYDGMFTRQTPEEMFSDWYVKTRQGPDGAVLILKERQEGSGYYARLRYQDADGHLIEESLRVVPLVEGESVLFKIHGWPANEKPRRVSGIKVDIKPARSYVTPTPTVDPALASQCAGFDAWYADTSVRVDRLNELAAEFAAGSNSEATFFLNHWYEMEDMADAQFRSSPPPIAMDAQNWLTSGLFAYADAFSTLAQQLNPRLYGSASYDPTKVTQAYNRLSEGDNDIRLAIPELDRIAAICA